MRKLSIVAILFIQPLNMAFADCDLTRFRWECDIPIKPTHTKTNHSLVYCGHPFGYINADQFELLSHYQQANINMVLKVNGEYIESPCVPVDRFNDRP